MEAYLLRACTLPVYLADTLPDQPYSITVISTSIPLGIQHSDQRPLLTHRNTNILQAWMFVT
jgi:hypothetical protein